MAYGLQTYDDTVRREDLVDLIADVSPDSNPLMTMLGTVKASGTYHEWMEEYFARPTSVTTSIEGATATFTDLTQPSRRGNFTQIITKNMRVSETEQAVTVAGMGDPFEYQRGKALRQWKNDAEYSLVRGVAASGSSGVARQMIGITAVTTTHSTARNSGTSLSEDEFNTQINDVWTDVGPDYVCDIVLVPAGLKRKISSFTAGNERYVDATDKKLTRPVSIYESDFGVHRIFAHKDVNNSAGTTHILGIKEDMWKVAYLRPPKYTDLAKVGDSKDGQIKGELTLEYRAERSGFAWTGYNQNG